MASVLDGTTKIKASHWPSFLYPPNTPYNRESLDDGLFTGPVLVAVGYYHLSCYQRVLTISVFSFYRTYARGRRQLPMESDEHRSHRKLKSMVWNTSPGVVLPM
jgi:hypothetical protein